MRKIKNMLIDPYFRVLAAHCAAVMCDVCVCVARLQCSRCMSPPRCAETHKSGKRCAHSMRNRNEWRKSCSRCCCCDRFYRWLCDTAGAGVGQSQIVVMMSKNVYIWQHVSVSLTSWHDDRTVYEAIFISLCDSELSTVASIGHRFLPNAYISVVTLMDIRHSMASAAKKISGEIIGKLGRTIFPLEQIEQ